MVRGQKRSRERYENKILKILIRDGMQKWTDLWVKIDWRGNKRFLRDCLKSLEEQKKIVNVEVSKKTCYAWAGDIEVLEQLRFWINDREKYFPKVQNDMKQSKTDSDNERVTKFYTFFMLKELSNYLKALFVWANADKKWKGVAQSIALNYNVRYFANLLLECMNSNPDAFDKAVGAVSETLDAMSSEVLKSGGFIDVSK